MAPTKRLTMKQSIQPIEGKDGHHHNRYDHDLLSARRFKASLFLRSGDSSFLPLGGHSALRVAGRADSNPLVLDQFSLRERLAAIRAARRALLLRIRLAAVHAPVAALLVLQARLAFQIGAANATDLPRCPGRAGGVGCCHLIQNRAESRNRRWTNRPGSWPRSSVQHLRPRSARSMSSAMD